MRVRIKRQLRNKTLLLLIVIIAGSWAFLGCMGGTPSQGWAGATEADGTLFTASMEGEVIALNASSGARLWGIVLETSRQSTGFGCTTASTTVW